MPEKTILKSNAKVNLALRITGKREDGYHTISTLFQEVDLHDEIIFEEAEQFSFSTAHPELPDNKNNLCVKAYFKMREFTNSKRNCKIYLDKNIPVGAGLGGGSSNAATVIKYLNEFWDLQFPDQKLQKIARTIGADVPFFIRGGTQIGEGIGDILHPIKLKPDFKILCLIPEFNISTQWAYKKFSLTNKKDKFNFDRLILGKKPKWKFFENQFEDIVIQSYPEISDMKRILLLGGAEYAGLSGSGSTVIGAFHKDANLMPIVRAVEYVTVVTNPMIN
ncbi:MAG: 4-(cytidine 5'-diphospho)-2-C-methyl-D-erythritol kinase [Candidatus Marinimicrobia bacterium]|nr:4-(cytidine 5'-diphospho)-2-C-methyl-D-erythritol kinase [Candidatus Neomarinimicrobiota bacterium]